MLRLLRGVVCNLLYLYLPVVRVNGRSARQSFFTSVIEADLVLIQHVVVEELRKHRLKTFLN